MGEYMAGGDMWGVLGEWKGKRVKFFLWVCMEEEEVELCGRNESEKKKR